MVLTATRGALGFLSRVPAGTDQEAWEAFGRTPVAFPLVGYLIGGLVALPLLVPGPSLTVAVIFVVGVYVVTGINHVDGVADLGDAMAAHGDAATRREIMHDTAVGAGGVLVVGVLLLGLGTAGVLLADLPSQALLLVVTAEVGAKVGMALLVCFGATSHEGLGSSLTRGSSPWAFGPVVLVGAPAMLLTWPELAPSLAAFGAAVVVALLLLQWARVFLDGVSGDVIGATNEFARVAALHTGVVVWTLC